jgi:DNA-directed RNA polymerase subunit beta
MATPAPSAASSQLRSAASDSSRASHSIPDLTEIQTRFYDRFLQYDTPASKRKDEGIEGVLREIFPIESYDRTVKLEYVRYELGEAPLRSR